MPSASGSPGWKTTEFWLKAAQSAVVLWGTVRGFIPPKYAVIVEAVGLAVYTIARTVSKAVSDIQATKSSTATVTTSSPVTTVTTPA